MYLRAYMCSSRPARLHPQLQRGPSVAVAKQKRHPNIRHPRHLCTPSCLCAAAKRHEFQSARKPPRRKPLPLSTARCFNCQQQSAIGAFRSATKFSSPGAARSSPFSALSVLTSRVSISRFPVPPSVALKLPG